MSVFINLHITALRAATLTIWPEVGVNGIWLGDDIDTVPWDNLNAPYAVMLVNQLTKANNAYDGANVMFTAPVEVYYIANYEGDMTALIDKAETWAIAMANEPLQSGQILSYDGIDWGKEIPANEILKSKNTSQRAIRIQFTVLMGFNPHN